MPIDTPFASEKPAFTPKRVDEIGEITIKGPWRTKSHAQLSVLFAFSPNEYIQLLGDYNPEELAKLPEDIRGIRSYTVRGIPEGNTGGIEFHRVRTEILFGLEGRVALECEDVWRGKKNFTITPEQGIVIPPFILHTYRAERPSGLLVVCNTLFNPENPNTHDSYSKYIFRALQAKYR